MSADLDNKDPRLLRTKGDMNPFLRDCETPRRQKIPMTVIESAINHVGNKLRTTTSIFFNKPTLTLTSSENSRPHNEVYPTEISRGFAAFQKSFLGSFKATGWRDGNICQVITQTPNAKHWRNCLSY